MDLVTTMPLLPVAFSTALRREEGFVLHMEITQRHKETGNKWNEKVSSPSSIKSIHFRRESAN